MTTIPLTILDDFLDNPNTIRDWGLSLPFNPSPDNRWPGKRTECLSTIHPPLYNYINRKILSLFFENLVNYSCSLQFQLIEDYQNTGWIHQDPDIFTYIIYLSPENSVNCGTSLYNVKSNKFHTVNSLEEDKNMYQSKRLHYKTKSITPEIQKLKNQNIDLNYNKTLDIKDKYNRLLCFSSEQHHSANNFSNGVSPRLTLIGFFKEIYSSKLPILRSKQTLM